MPVGAEENSTIWRKCFTFAKSCSMV